MIRKDARGGILFLIYRKHRVVITCESGDTYELTFYKERIKYDKKSIKRTGIFDVIPRRIS